MMNEPPQPPRWAYHIMRLALHERHQKEVLGDLEEGFKDRHLRAGQGSATRWYWTQVLRSLPAFVSQSIYWSAAMLKNYLKMAARHLAKQKLFSTLNIGGLSTGLACALLILLWVNDELQVDTFHEKDRQLFQVMANHEEAKGISTIESTPGLLAEALAEEMPEVEVSVAVIDSWGEGILSAEDIHIKASLQFASKDFFKVFSYPLIQGDKNQVLSDKNTIVISEELALKLFQTTDNVVGKTVTWDRSSYKGSYFISGIFASPPPNATHQFDLLFSYDLFMEKRPFMQDWRNSEPSTYVILKEETNIDQFNEKIARFVQSKYEQSNITIFLRRYSDKYLYDQYANGIQAGGRIEYVRLFSLIALFILAIACINFMNLSTASASGRTKEVGVKKAIGAPRQSLVFQYLGESMMMAFLSLLLAVLLVALILSPFNELTGKQLVLHFDSMLILSVLGITLITGLVAGSYPALYLSGFNPALVLKGKLPTSAGELWVRKGLVVFQFALAVIFIVSVLVLYQQISYVQSKNLGYDRDQIIILKTEGSEPFLSEVKNIPEVLKTGDFDHNLTGDHGNLTRLSWEGKTGDDVIEFANLEIGFDLIETLGIEVVAGRSFSRAFPSDHSAILLNETAVAVMGLEDPIGKTVVLWGKQKQIVGVTKDFHFESLHEAITPLLFQLFPFGDNILVKVKAGAEKEALDQLQKRYQEFNPGIALEYTFLDDEYRALYASEQQIGILSRYFAGLAILISCLGLFGLAAFTAQRRRKEIGIRKVLGSTEFSIVYLLSIDFTKMVGVALTIALPVSYVLARKWLDGFAYRIDLELWYFASAGLITLFIAWFTVGVQTVKAAKSNPVHCLREE